MTVKYDDLLNLCSDELASDEYINKEDNLFYCKRCNTPRQKIIISRGEKFKVPIPCTCQDEENDRAKEKKHILEVNTKNKADIQAIGLETKLFSVTLKDDDRANADISKLVEDYINNFPKYKKSNTGIMFMGNVGVGKTFYSKIIVSELYRKGYLILPIKIFDLMKIYQNFRNISVIDKFESMLRSHDLVFIDDLGAERQTGFTTEKLFNVFDIRCEAKKPLIVTTNLTNKDINNASKDVARIYDRVNYMCKLKLLIKGKSRRVRK